MAIAAFSPHLDQFGNSVRAQAAITHIADTLRLGLYLAPPRKSTTEKVPRAQ